MVFVTQDADEFQSSIIRSMTLAADELGAVNLSQGMPDFAVPERVKQAAKEALDRDDLNQYSPPVGLFALRQAVADHAKWHLGLDVDPETEVTITCGSTEAMCVALRALVKPKDNVLIPAPYYENYLADCTLAGACPRHVYLRPPGWKLDHGDVEEAFHDYKPRVIVLCNPNNPTGTVYTRDDLDFIAKLCVRHDTVAVTDEVYEHILYDPPAKHYAIAACEGMRERSVTISSASKTFSTTGWRIGSVIAPPDKTARIRANRPVRRSPEEIYAWLEAMLMAVPEKTVSGVVRQFHDFTTICAPTPLQSAIASAYGFSNGYYTQLAKEYTQRRDFLYDVLTETGFDVTKPQGAYYIMARIDHFHRDPSPFAVRLLREAGVATVPGSCFFDKEHQARGNPYIRFCFCKRQQTLEQAAERLRAWRRRA